MSPLDAFWHLLNFFGPAVGIGAIASLLAKLAFRRQLTRSWLALWLWATLASAIVLLVGLVVFGHDGRMATYGAMVAGCALSLWWVGLRPLRR